VFSIVAHVTDQDLELVNYDANDGEIGHSATHPPTLDPSTPSYGAPRILAGSEWAGGTSCVLLGC
jgi:hypothetical protein